jgi:hypothetical protein
MARYDYRDLFAKDKRITRRDVLFALGAAALAGAGYAADKKFGILTPDKVSTRYKGEWDRHDLDCGADPGAAIQSVSGELSARFSKRKLDRQLSHYTDSHFWVDEIARKNPGGLTNTGKGCYIWVPRAYKE